MTSLQRLTERLITADRPARLRLGAIVAGVLVLALLFTTANDRVRQLARKRSAREKDLAEMLSLRQRYLQAKAVSQKLSNRLAATRPDDSPAKLIDDIGIKGKGSQIKPVKGEERPGGIIEDAAEVRIDALTANELVNLLYRLEKGDKPAVIKRLFVKTRFDDPSRLDLTMTIALLKGAPQGQK